MTNHIYDLKRTGQKYNQIHFIRAFLYCESIKNLILDKIYDARNEMMKFLKTRIFILTFKKAAKYRYAIYVLRYEKNLFFLKLQ